MVKLYCIPDRPDPITCFPGYNRVRGLFSIVKGQVWACLCKSVGLVGLKTHGLVITSPLGFHSKEYWLSDFVHCHLMGRSPLSCWAICALVGVWCFLGWTHQDTWPRGSQPHSCLCYVEGDCTCKGCHTRFSTPHLCPLGSLFSCMTPIVGSHLHPSS